MNSNNYFKFSKFSLFILSLIILITLISAYLIYQQDNEKRRIIFENNAMKLTNLIENRMLVYEQILLAGAAKFYTTENISREDWKKFVEELKLKKTFPGFQGVGFSLKIKPEDKENHVVQMRSEGFDNYDIKPNGIRKIYTSIIYLEPFDDRNKRAFGYDMYSEQTRQKAMNRAIDTGEYSLSGKVHLLQENGIDVQAGFLAYIPVYKPNMSMTNFSDRFEATYGFVYAPFRAKDLISSLDLVNNKFLDVEIFDSEVDDYNSILYDSIVDHTNINPNYSYTEQLSIGGKNWLIKITPENDFFKNVESLAYIVVLVFGIFLIIFTMIIVYIFNFYELKKQTYFDNLKDLSLKEKLALQVATIGTWEWNFKDNSIKWDSTMNQIYGIKEISNTDLFEVWKKFVDKDYKAKVFRNLMQAKDKNEEHNINFWIMTSTGERKYIHSLGIVEKDKNNKPFKMIGINQDITLYETNRINLLEKNQLIEFQKFEFESIFKYSKDGIAIVDLKTNFLFFNDAYLKMTGYEREELLKKSCLEMTSIEDYKKFGNILPEVLEKGFYENLEKSCIVNNNKRIQVNMSMVLLPDKKRFLISAKDFTEIRKKEKLIGDYVDLIDKNVITSSTDINGNITFASEAFCKISGYSKEELIGKNHNIVRDSETPNDVYYNMWSSLINNKSWKGELKNVKKDKSSYWVKATISPIFDENGTKIGYTSIREDITDKKIIEKLSITDALTDLNNRRYFNDIFPKYIQTAKRKNEIVCFGLMDIDFFKQYNDTYGHQMGDEVLSSVGKVIKNSLCRADDYSFRLGGEEFGILFKTENIENAFNFVQSIKNKIESEQMVHAKNSASPFVTASIGLICLNANDIKDSEEVYKFADDLLYKAKESGRNKVVMN